MKRPDLTLIVLLAVAFLPSTNISAQVLSDGQPSVLKEDKAQPNYVYDLKVLIKKSRENIKNVDDKIKEQAVIKRNQKREDKAREYYQKALKLQEEGRLDEARELFDKAIRITEHPEMVGYIKSSARRSKLQADALRKEEVDIDRRSAEEEKSAMERVESTYQSAVSLYKQQRYKDAKTEFQVVEELYPDYKAARSYLQIVEQDIAQEDNRQMKDQKKEVERQQTEAEVARLREKELWRKEIAQKEDTRKDQLKKQADAVYGEALKLYQQNKYQEAKAKFQEVEWVVPDFKSTRSYLNKIDKDIDGEKRRLIAEHQKEMDKQKWAETLEEKKSEEERKRALEQKEKERLAQVKDQAEFLYIAGVALFDKGELEQAKEKFDEIEKLYPNYKSTPDYIKKIDQSLFGLGKRDEAIQRTDAERKIWEEEMFRRKAEKDKFEKSTEGAADGYTAAMDLYRRGRLIEAKEKLLAVDQMVPDYKSCRETLKRIDRDIELLVKTRQHEEAVAEQKADLDRLKDLQVKVDGIYKEGIKAYEAKNFEVARAKLEEVEKTFPDYNKTKFILEHIDEDIQKHKDELQRMENERKAEEVYAQAVKLYTAYQYVDAKKKFIETESIVHNYKDIAKYLERVDDEIIKQKEDDLTRVRELQVQAPYNDAVALYQKEEFEAAKAKFLEVSAVAPEYKDIALYIGKIDRDIERKKTGVAISQKTMEAETLYKEAIAFYRAADYKSAKEKFVKLEILWPDFKDASQYIRRIDEDIISKENKEDITRRAGEAEMVYAKALEAYRAQDLATAHNQLIEVQTIYPNYKDSTAYLARVGQDSRKQEEMVGKQERLRRSEALYTEALSLYAARDFGAAKKKFTAAVIANPEHKSARTYLGRIDQDIRDEIDRRAREEKDRQTEELYAQAVTFYHNSDFISAKDKLSEVELLTPNYKKTKTYLSGIDENIRLQKLENERISVQKADEHYRQAHLLLAQENLAEAYRELLQAEKLYPNYKSVPEEMKIIKERLATKGIAVEETPVSAAPSAVATVNATTAMTDEQVFEKYKAAVILYKDKKYTEAKAAFQQILEARPDYRSTQKYLDSIKGIGALREAPAVDASAEPSMPAVSEAKGAAIQDERAKQEEIRSLYEKAVDSFKAKEYDAAFEKFRDINLRSPGYRSTTDYIKKIEQAKAEIERTKTQEQIRAARGQTASSAKPESKKKDDQQARAEAIYAEAIQLYKNDKYDQAKAKFTEVLSIIPNYKSSSNYLSLITQAEGSETASAATHEAAPSASASINNKDAAVIRELTAKSKAIYAQIKALSQDKEIANASRTFAQVDKIVAELEAQQREIQSQSKEQEQQEQNASVSGLQAEQKNLVADERRAAAQAEKLRRKESHKELRDEHNRQGEMGDRKRELEQKAGDLYQEALKAYRGKDYAVAKERLMSLENLRPGYKDTLKFLNRVEREEDQAKLVQEENSDRQEIVALAERANAMNLKLLKLSQQRNYEDARKKFDEMSGILKTAQDIKERMMSRRNKFTARWADRAAEVKENGQKILLAQSSIKRRDEKEARLIREQAQQLFREGQQLYAAERYPEAKTRFLDAARMDPSLKAAMTYVGRIERILDKKDFEIVDKRGSAAATGGKKIPAEDRSASLLDSGKQLYRDKHYREARIKFEELTQIGNKEQRDTAKKYLALVEKGLQADKAEAAQNPQGEQEPNEQAKNLGNKDKKKAVTPAVQEGTSPQQKREIEIQRQQELRAIEQDNMREREQVLDQKSGAPSSQADRQPSREDVARRDKLEMEKAQLQKDQQRLKKQLDLERSKYQRERDLLEKARREQEQLVKKSSAAKSTRQQARPESGTQAGATSFPMREDSAIGSKSSSAAPRIIAVPASAPASVSDKAVAMRLAAEEEKRVLNQQREAIRRDFEAGIERLYSEAVTLYKQRMYEEARQDFLQVKELMSGYKKTEQYLDQIDQNLKTSSKRSAATVTQAPARKNSSVNAAPTKDRRKAISDALDAFDTGVDR